jgi:hypothetical protein
MTDTIKNTISRFAEGFVFTAEDFPIPPDKQNTVSKVLNNMVAVGQIRRTSTRHLPNYKGFARKER